ncbi:MAG: hypothetical protein QXQ61_04530 [Candidatus Bathyarchaeia archaeon]
MKTSMAQVFTHTGEGLVLRGGRAIVEEKTRSPHLSKNAAFQLMKDIIQLYQRQMGQPPIRLVVHKSSRHWSEELSGFNEAAKDVKIKDYVAIQSRGIRFMRKKGIYPPIRGTVIKIGEKITFFSPEVGYPITKLILDLECPSPSKSWNITVILL